MRAYLSIRTQSKLLVRLFTMMVMAGIPQLMSVADVEYLKQSLALDKNDQEAVDHFKLKIREAIDNSWSTSVNWWFHIKNTA